ncbi:MAG: helix-turn-helix domain-containing protein [Myxococcales bacterium]|nr:helix-turn-helix domain-containing protein [Myxococcales bacterium]
MTQVKTPDRRKKARSIGWLAEIYFRDGRQAAQTALEAISPGDLLQNYRVVRKGEPALRTTAEQQDRILYQTFAPPLWAWPYSILRASFDPAEKDRFMHHGGEEILLPIEGSISYHFFCSAGSGAPTRTLLPEPVEPGSVIRIDPQIPHHAWAAGDEPAVAWMIIRDLTHTTASTHLDLPRDVSLEVESPRRQLTADELAHSERYALVAWGISEKIRIGRLGAGLTIRQLAAACEIDPAQLSRIENGSAASNVSLEVVLRIARCLGLEIQQLLSAEFIDQRNPFKTETLDQAGGSGKGDPLLCIREPHFIHLHHWKVPEGETVRLEEGRGDAAAQKSWIVLNGEAIFELADPIAGTTKELVDHDSVIHIRNDASLEAIHALQELELLQVTYSARCSGN